MGVKLTPLLIPDIMEVAELVGKKLAYNRGLLLLHKPGEEEC